MAIKDRGRGFTFLKNWYGHWWMMALQGLLFGVIGAVCFFKTGETVAFVARLIGIALLIIGCLYLLMFFADPIIGGFGMGRAVTDIIIGLILTAAPQFVVGFFIALIGIFSIIAGVSILGVDIHTSGSWRFIKIVVSVLLIIFGIMAFIRPGDFITFFVRILAVVLMVVGVYMIVNAFSLRKEIKAIKKEEEGFTDYKVQ